MPRRSGRLASGKSKRHDDIGTEVWSSAEVATPVDEAALIARGLLGSYRRAIGWSREARHPCHNDGSRVILDKYYSNTL